ncbi:hypothetical protein PG991_006017 [Apiospora marii]|uniref:Uncharacterized protein n=1 Tax=Apiospora marii TaxID=335849 RepID=A0ABR1SAU4_9PEZI
MAGLSRAARAANQRRQGAQGAAWISSSPGCSEQQLVLSERTRWGGIRGSHLSERAPPGRTRYATRPAATFSFYTFPSRVVALPFDRRPTAPNCSSVPTVQESISVARPATISASYVAREGLPWPSGGAPRLRSAAQLAWQSGVRPGQPSRPDSTNHGRRPRSKIEGGGDSCVDDEWCAELPPLVRSRAAYSPALAIWLRVLYACPCWYTLRNSTRATGASAPLCGRGTCTLGRKGRRKWIWHGTVCNRRDQAVCREGRTTVTRKTIGIFRSMPSLVLHLYPFLVSTVGACNFQRSTRRLTS